MKDIIFGVVGILTITVLSLNIYVLVKEIRENK
jgi:hypothetical protein